MLTQPGSDLAWDWPSGQVTALSEDEDASGVATTIIVTANGPIDTSGNQVPLIARADNTDLTGIPAMWRINTDHIDVTQQATLDSYAVAYASQARAPVVLRPFTVRADDPDHPLGHYLAGYTCQLTVTGDPWITDGSYTQRITDMAVSGLNVTLTVEAT